MYFYLSPPVGRFKANQYLWLFIHWFCWLFLCYLFCFDFCNKIIYFFFKPYRPDATKCLSVQAAFKQILKSHWSQWHLSMSFAEQGHNVQPVKNEMKNLAFHSYCHHKMSASIFTHRIKPSNVKVVTSVGAFSASSCCDLAFLVWPSPAVLQEALQSAACKAKVFLIHSFDMASGAVECRTLRQNIGGTKSRCYRLIGGNWSSSSYTCLNWSAVWIWKELPSALLCFEGYIACGMSLSFPPSIESSWCLQTREDAI